ncbi:hypothetical protein JNUCC64_02935 [Streptomyces sp. JNUCC 64]
MATGERRAWITALVAVVAYAGYLVAVLGRADGRPLAEVPYTAALLWSVGGAVVATVVLEAVAAAVFRADGTATDVRDREIGRLGEHVGQSFLAIGGLGVLALAVVEADHFWIAQTVQLAFVLSALLGSATRIACYRVGFQSW